MNFEGKVNDDFLESTSKVESLKIYVKSMILCFAL